MKRIMLTLSCIAMLVGLTSCKDNSIQQQKQVVDQSMKQEREFMDQAIRHRSPDVQKVEIIGNTVVYTHIFDGIVDVKTYTYDGDICVEAERVYTFPNQMKALRHYRNAVEKAELYDNIQMFNNEVRYDLKQQQHELETKGLTKEQLKAKFDKQIDDAKADMKKMDDKMKKDCKDCDKGIHKGKADKHDCK
ncbi:MAG: hypothetical protein IJZ70_08060 [Bacteroidales bacterium]|nr:hypothetical protein [Bacteroidales bacterium]